jgi:sugar phosphate isomerase/epimerase
MKIGLITDSVGHLPLESALDLAKELGLSSVEVATGNWSEAPHADLPALVSSAEARAEFAEKISSRGLTLSALCANGNQLHPIEGPEQDKVVRNTITLASNLEVPTVVLMSGLPGARGDSTPNWITTSWPPETLKVLDYQWNEVAIPYWKELAAFARDNGVRLAVEACGSQLVHSVSTMFRLIEAAGDDVVGANLVSRVGSSFTLRLGQDGVGVLGPDERFAALIPAGDEAADGIDELADGVEAAAADGLAGDDSEEDLHQVQPGSRRRGEVQRDPRVAGQLGLDLGVLVGGVVVADLDHSPGG